MEAYRPIMLNLTHVVALWAVAYIAAALTPQSILEYVLLGLASLWLLYATWLMQKEHRRPTSLFFCGCALMPWAFYGELIYINANNEGIDPEVFAANLKHAIFIYQSFKFVFLVCAFFGAVKGLYQAVRDFANYGPR